MNNPALRGLPKRLVSDGLLNEETAVEILETCQKENRQFVQTLVETELLPSHLIANVASAEFATPLYDLSCHNISVSPKGLLEKKLMAKHQMMPLFKRGKKLFVALSDPTNQHAVTDARFQTGLTVEPILVEQDKLSEAMVIFLKEAEEDLGEALGTMDDLHLDDLDIAGGEEPDLDDDDSATDDAPIVRFINKILIDAIKKGASDIHFEPYEKAYRIRVRTDGILEEVARPPVNLSSRLAARLKVMSQLDISERRVPQDGRIKLKLTKTRSIDFRVNTLPTQFGEKIVLRILDSGSAKVGIDSLGYEEDQKQAYMEALHKPQGMILVTGPTGSGKTVSLYTGMNILNTDERNISAAEDPIEINMEGINQVQISQKVGLTFPEVLRAFLRQDPDVIMVGEIRDLETAEISIKAAQTGHLVLSTLHTNSSPETLTRLLNMGVPAFNVATSIDLIIAQRLARKLCESCKIPADDIPHNILESEGLLTLGIPQEQLTIFHPNTKGCKLCTHGYKGRIGVYEILKITPAISRIIMEGGHSIDIQDAATKEGFRTLRQSALRKAAQGIISLEEVNRVTKD